MDLEERKKRIVELGKKLVRPVEIAKQVGLNPVTEIQQVYNVLKENGIPPRSLDSRVERTNRSQYVINQERYNKLVTELVGHAEETLAKLHQETLVYSFGGKENTYSEAYLPEPGARDRLDHAKSVQTFLKAAQDLQNSQTGQQTAQASLLDQTAQALGLDDAGEEFETLEDIL